VRIRWQQVVSFVFLLLGMLPAVFMLLVCIKKSNIRHEMKEKMEKQLLHTVTLKNEDIVWVKAGKEIMAAGKMFDVKSYKSANGTTIFTGLYDDEETRLNAIVNNEMGKRSERKNLLLTQVLQLLQTLFWKNIDAGYVAFVIPAQYPPAYADKTTELSAAVLYPPPDADYNIRAI
jgi:hypothetical protein